MTIRFAPARNRNALVHTVTWGATGLHCDDAANDNGILAEEEALLAETLRHFAAHGMSAAAHARDLAAAAGRAGDEAGFERWLAVCRMLDKRMAKVLAANAEFAGG